MKKIVIVQVYNSLKTLCSGGQVSRGLGGVKKVNTADAAIFILNKCMKMCNFNIDFLKKISRAQSSDPLLAKPTPVS